MEDNKEEIITNEEHSVVQEQPFTQQQVEPNNNGKKRNNKLIFIIALVVLILGLGGYLVYTLTSKSSNAETDKEEKNQKNVVKTVDLSKCINNKSVTFKDLDGEVSTIGLEVVVNGNDTNLKINWEKFGPVSGASAWANRTEELKIQKLAKKVKSGFVGGEGQDSKGTILFYLMEDGTVEYTRLFNQNNVNYTYDKDADGKITGQHFESEGTVKNVKDVVKLYTVQVIDGQSGYMTTIAAKKDGSFYDLGYEIRKNSKNENDSNTKEEVKTVDLSKCINNKSVTFKDLDGEVSTIGLEVVVNGNDTNLKINWEKFGPVSGASAWANRTEELKIQKLAKKVKSGFVGGEGQDSKGTILFYLMEDGTVEYTRLFNQNNVNYTYDKDADGKITGQHFESEGTVKNVKDVVKLYTVQVSDGQSGYMTTIAAKKDGSFYDLGYEIRN